MTNKPITINFKIGQVWQYNGKIKSFPKKAIVVKHKDGKRLILEGINGERHGLFLITIHKPEWKLITKPE